MTDDELIQRHLETKGVVACPPGIAAGLSRIEALTGVTAVPLKNGTYRERMAAQIEADFPKWSTGLLDLDGKAAA